MNPQTSPVWARHIAYATALALGLGVAAMGYAGSFTHLQEYGATHGFPFRGAALPIGLDLGIPALLLLDWLNRSLFLRVGAWSLALWTVFANGAVADGSLTGRLLHATMPAVAIVIVEAARHLRDDPTQMDRIRWSRYLVAPVRTVRIRARMIAWEVTSYTEALRLESAVLYAQAMLTAELGGKSWRQTRKRVPVVLLHSLRTWQMPAGLAYATDWEAAVRDWIRGTLDELNPQLKPKPRHVICAGPDGLLFLRRPTPARREPAGDIGTPADLEAVLQGAHAPVVYFARNGNRVKIGTTRNLRQRMSALCLRIKDVAFVLHGDQEYEDQLHQRFAAYRIGNSEWFKTTGELAEFVAAKGIEPYRSESEPDQAGTDVPEPPADRYAAAVLAYRYSLTPGMQRLSQRALMDRYGLTKREAMRAQAEVDQDGTDDAPEPDTDPANSEPTQGLAVTHEPPSANGHPALDGVHEQS